MNWELLLNSNLVGSLLGTTIAGLVAVGVMRSQLRNDRIIRRKKELEIILKMTKNFAHCSSLIYKEITKMRETFAQTDLTEQQIKNIFMKLEFSVKNYISRYSYSASNAPYEVFHLLTKNEYFSDYALAIIRDVVLTENLTFEKDQIGKEIDELYSIYEDILEQINKSVEANEAEYKKLKK